MDRKREDMQLHDIFQANSAADMYLYMAENVIASPQEFITTYMEKYDVQEVVDGYNQEGAAGLLDSLSNVAHDVPLAARIYLNYNEHDGLEVKLVFAYGEKEINPLADKSDGGEDKNHSAAIEAASLSHDGADRDWLKENVILAIFQDFAFCVRDGILLQSDDDLAFEFLHDGLPVLAKRKNVEIFYSSSFKKKPVMEFSSLSIGISISEGNLLKVSLDDKNINFKELLAILRAYRKKEKYYKLTGQFIALENANLSAIAELLENLKFNQVHENYAEVPLARIMLLDDIRREKGVQVHYNKRVEKVLANLHQPELSEYNIPASLENTLRDYQKTGAGWLKHLADLGLGGILADDMGVGKTLQILAFLLAEKENGFLSDAEHRNLPALLVVPKSLMYNWQAEIEKFTPEIDFALVYGNKKQRRLMWKSINDDRQIDLLIATYGVMKSDIDDIKKLKFSYCFLDEAQCIKNMFAKVTLAAKQIRAGSCFAATGTPMENNLAELWSVFDFVLPGFLQSYYKFRHRYEFPIIAEKNSKVLMSLKRRIAPFILRRMKTEVVAELPEKCESVVWVAMTEQQGKLYASYASHAKSYLRKQLRKNGLKKQEIIKITVLLTRLRQIACNPEVFLENYHGGSGKLEALLQIVRQGVEGSHGILVYSQFVQMLDCIGRKLQENGIEYLRLDGSTPAKDRLALADRFNRGEVPVFLISLKAGGTGLNLIGADMVVHYDPWWNPAVENQASDRAYRIGQKRNVQIIKLITNGTIEEKIYDLQMSKKELADKIITSGSTLLGSMQENEIMDLFS